MTRHAVGRGEEERPVGRGEPALTPALAAKLLQEFAHPARPAAELQDLDELTDREQGGAPAARQRHSEGARTPRTASRLRLIVSIPSTADRPRAETLGNWRSRGSPQVGEHGPR